MDTMLMLLSGILTGGTGSLLGMAGSWVSKLLQGKDEDRKLRMLEKGKEWTAFTAAIRADTAGISKASTWVINIKQLVRPILTLTLLGMTGWILWMEYQSKGALAEGTRQTITFLTCMAVSFWFGERALQRPDSKL